MCFCFLCVPCLSFASVQTVGVSSVPLQCLFGCFSVVSGFSQAWFLKDNCCLALVKCQCWTKLIFQNSLFLCAQEIQHVREFQAQGGVGEASGGMSETH